MVKLADTQRDKEQRRLQQQLVQQIQQLNNASTWGNLAGLGTLTPQYLAVSAVFSTLFFLGAVGALLLRPSQPTCVSSVLHPPQLLQQATSTTNQGSFNGLQRLGSEFTFSPFFFA